ncbi:MAG: biosynthetic-type acetolactate synthase large subunit [Treponema sp.]|jgi:acetolactate synthase-1/2/3 large subunit|nr:biosynthetic-type acetolactate synthase large subunit [Treponema sp.]
MLGAEIVADRLIAHGVDTVFGYPGAAILSVYEALWWRKEKIRHILVSHEQHAAHAADGYARSRGTVGVCLATSGPGATNLLTGIATAALDSSPVLAITANVATTALGKDSFQEIDIVGLTMPIVKHSWLVKTVDELAFVIEEAFIVAQARRPGPVLIDIPYDVLESEGTMTNNLETARIKRLRTNSSVERVRGIEEAQALIVKAARPLIYAGGGIIRAQAQAELLSLAEHLDAPVALSLMGTAAFPRSHRLCLGTIGLMAQPSPQEAFLREADLIIALGTRFSDRTLRHNPFNKNNKTAKILHCDSDDAEINKNIRADLSLVADLKTIIPLLTQQIPPRAAQHVPAPFPEEPDNVPRTVITQCAQKIGNNAIVVTDVGQHQLWTIQYYPFDGNTQCVTSGGLGTMGFGLGAAIGAQCANPHRPVVLFTGDGSFRMNCAELATVAAYQIPILIIVFNNHALGLVKTWQDIRYEGRYSETILKRPPDFVKLSAAYQIPGFRADTESAYIRALDAAMPLLNNHTAVLIEVLVES